MENCIPSDYTTYTTSESIGGLTISINPPGAAVGFKPDWAIESTESTVDSQKLNLMLPGDSTPLAVISTKEFSEDMEGNEVYMLLGGLSCFKGTIVKNNSLEYQADMNNIGTLDNPIQIEDDSSSDDDNSDNSVPDETTTEPGITDVEFCVNNLHLYDFHKKIDLSTSEYFTEVAYNTSEYVYQDKYNNSTSVEIRGNSELKFSYWYNALEYTSYENMETIPLERINHFVFFEQTLSDITASNFNDMVVFKITKNNFGDDTILVQLDNETSEKFNVDMGCYILEFNGSLDSYEFNDFIKSEFVENNINFSILSPYNVPSPTPTPTATPTPTVTPTATPTATPTPTDTIGTYVEVSLKQNEQGLRFYMGWYGVCGYNCRPFDLTEPSVRAKIFRVFQINEQNDNYSIFNTSFDPKHDNFYQDFNELECGHPYLIVLEKGSGSLIIPGFVEAKKMSEDVGRLTRKCVTDYDDSEVVEDEVVPVQDCCDEMNIDTNTTEEGDGYKFIDKNLVSGTSTIPGKLCWNEFTGDPAGIAVSYDCPIESDGGPFSEGGFSLEVGYALNDTNNLFRFYSADGDCYEVKLENVTGYNYLKKLSD